MAIPAEFRSLFWDCSLEHLDMDNHRSVIIERILNYGDEDAFRWMFRQYSDEAIIDVIKNNRLVLLKAALIRQMKEER